MRTIELRYIGHTSHIRCFKHINHYFNDLLITGYLNCYKNIYLNIFYMRAEMAYLISLKACGYFK